MIVVNSETSMQKNRDIIFPFSAVQGQSQFKLALLLATVNPLIGGVLISGPRGCAKSTLARAVADLLPVKKDHNPQFVTLPLGASEEMLIGSLDLDSVLNAKNVKFSPGLLKKADMGVLYVDEVNLLSDHLVDQLLDVASSGVNIVERDGISHRHDSRFTLIGTMNPDEGELRPQLQDRFGLMVTLDNTFSIEERISIIKARQAFEENKVAFCNSVQVQQVQLQQQISDAQKLLSDVSCDEQCFIEIATLCQQACVDGLRADIVMHRASLTHAAWCGRTQVTSEDIRQVAPLVLVHRQQASVSSNTTPPNPTQQNKSDKDSSTDNNKENKKHPSNNSSGFSRPQPPKLPPLDNKDGNNIDNEQHDNTGDETQSGAGEWGAMPAANAEKQKIDNKLNVQLTDLAKKISTSSFNANLKSNARNNRKSNTQQCLGSNRSDLLSNKPDWVQTLSKSLGQWPPAQLAFKKQTTSEQKCHLILLDSSASTLSDNLSASAKSVVKSITDNAYLQRDIVSLLGFGNDSVETIIKAGSAPKKIGQLLDDISALGGTPLRLALQKAAQTIKQLSLKFPNISIFCYLITDGRIRVDIDDLKLFIPTMLIDIEKAQIKRGRGELLAGQLDATYVSLQG